MKKSRILSLILALAMVLSASVILSACGDKKSGDDSEKNDKISVISREEGSGTRGAFIELVGIEEKNDQGEKIDNTVDTAVITNSTSVAMTSVSEDKASIGYISLASLNDTVKALKIDGVEPTVKNIQKGEYPIARNFNLVTGDNLSELGKDFINYILSTEGQKTVSENGYIELTEAGKYEASDAVKEGGKITIGGSSSVTPLMEKLGRPTLFCNTLEVADNGEITGFKMRVEQSKLTTVKALQSIGFDTIASGDSYNDLGMIQASKAGFLFRSTDKIKADYPEIPAYEEYDELLAAIRNAMK